MRPAFALLRTCVRAWAPHTLKASPAEHIPASAKRLLHTLQTSPATRPALAPAHAHALSRSRVLSAIRSESTAAAPKQPNTSTTAPESRLDREQVPSYELTFTCNVCKTRSSHRLSKQGYHKGTVLISCPDCKNRHLISDHLKIFSDKSVTIEDLLREKGDLVKRGSLSAEGDVEFWDDGSSTPRSAHFHPESKPKGDERFVEQPSTQKPSSE